MGPLRRFGVLWSVMGSGEGCNSNASLRKTSPSSRAGTAWLPEGVQSCLVLKLVSLRELEKGDDSVEVASDLSLGRTQLSPFCVPYAVLWPSFPM